MQISVFPDGGLLEFENEKKRKLQTASDDLQRFKLFEPC